jgi:GntR family transcriptional repressor for pyruvate dehydrogenase complex
MDTLSKITSLARRPSAASHVSEQLTELVRSGNLKSGDVLPSEHELAIAFRVSRPVVREALRGLQIAGMLETRQGGRCSVTELDVTRMLEPLQLVIALNEGNLSRLYEARVVAECGLLRLGAPALTEEALAELTDIARAGHHAVDDPVAFRVVDLEFHHKLMTLAGNPFLETTARGLYGLGMEYRRVASAMPGVIAQSAAEHDVIVAALATRDPDRAAEAMRAHLTSIHRTTRLAMQRLQTQTG